MKILLGWYGCKDRYLAKYGTLVNDLGYSQLRAILPVEHVSPGMIAHVHGQKLDTASFDVQGIVRYSGHSRRRC